MGHAQGREAGEYVPRERIMAGTNCGTAPMRWHVAYGTALAPGAALARKTRKRFG